MAMPMTIHEARQLQEADLAVGDDAIRQAQDEADEAAQLVAAIERQAVESAAVPKASGSQAAEADQLAYFAAKRLERTQQLADRAKAARRLLDLEQVGKDVEQIHAAAAKPGDSMVAALQQIAAAAQTLRQLAAAHNTKVSAAISSANALGAEPAAPAGPRASSAHVAVHTGQRRIQSGSAVVQPVDKRTIDEAVEIAVKGDTDAAVRRLSAAHTVAQAKRFDHYYIGGNGLVQGQDDGQRRDGGSINPWPAKVARREARELSPAEVDAYMDGRFDGHQGTA